MSKFLALLIFGSFFNAFSQWTENVTPTYPELIQYFEELAEKHAEIELYAMGESDYGLPIYVCVINGAKDSIKTFEKARNETTLLINNGIHAGEPDGINACLIWIDEWIKNGKITKNLPVIAIIPAYNVGGMMNRSTNSRANQNGPDEYGFRGNAQNLDLNRDFIKMDSKNAFTFATIFHALDPDVFVDTHVSNGADYHYTLTYISSMKERMAPSIEALTYSVLIPDLTKSLKKKSWDLFTYIELVKETPEDGIIAFNDLPRYAMGYTALFDAISFTLETHMLKPFPQRVQATHDFIADLITFSHEHSTEIEKARLEARNHWQKQDYFKFNYQLSNQKDSLLFKGFEFTEPISEVTGLPRLKYHRDRPFEKYVPYYQSYSSNDSVKVPNFIIVNSQETEVLERLKANQISYKTLEKDTLIQVMNERVHAFEAPKKPYEGHYFHSKMETTFEKNEILFKKGDVMIDLKQPKRQFLLSTLISKADDSYFRWNFFDSYLQQKEYFSPYVFEDQAIEILAKNPTLKAAFEQKKRDDKAFRESSWDQLYFIYQHSELFEKSFHLLPVSFGW